MVTETFQAGHGHTKQDALRIKELIEQAQTRHLTI